MYFHFFYLSDIKIVQITEYENFRFVKSITDAASINSTSYLGDGENCYDNIKKRIQELRLILWGN